jgi:transposase InsO family protein
VETAVALCDVLRQYSAPYSIWTNHGEEFEGTFESIFKERDIRDVYSAPYDSQQNGECQRIWRTIEMATTADDVASLTAEYNRLPHFGLS